MWSSHLLCHSQSFLLELGKCLSMLILLLDVYFCLKENHEKIGSEFVNIRKLMFCNRLISAPNYPVTKVSINVRVGECRVCVFCSRHMIITIKMYVSPLHIVSIIFHIFTPYLFTHGISAWLIPPINTVDDSPMVNITHSRGD